MHFKGLDRIFQWRHCLNTKCNDASNNLVNRVLTCARLKIIVSDKVSFIEIGVTIATWWRH